ncbi:MAG: helix-turn-helix domain-containing protein [Burkholderiales bacterium]|jgi:transcriptional regulator with XRE-family HTH domain|nr:helix-turn-helix domain-containing protein [Burkholderiales bacterium]
MSQKRNRPETIFCRRLKEARQAAGFSQKNLGIAAGIDEFAASARINRYEQAVHEADAMTIANLAKVLDVPLAYFYAEDDRLAQMILVFEKLPAKDQEKLLQQIEARGESRNASQKKPSHPSSPKD